MAALLLLERLTPLEQAVLVSREVFGFAFPRSHRPSADRGRVRSNSRPGRDATWTAGAGLDSRQTAGNARS